jgi:RepB DNA-primase from phage plasmid
MPDTLTSWDFLKKLYQPTDTVGVIAFEARGQALKASAQTKQFIVLASEAWSPAFQSRLRQMNSKGLNISVGANALRTGSSTRTKEAVHVPRYLFLDLDTKNGVTGKQKLDHILGDPKCPVPGFVINTSPTNYQVLWTVDGFTKDAAEDMLRRLAAHYGGDPAIGGDISRAIRIPGLRNKKYAAANPQQNIETKTGKDKEYGPTVTGFKHSDAVHTPAAFAYLPVLEPPTIAPVSPPPTAAISSPALPNGFDAETRTAYQGSGRSSGAAGRDDSDSGKDYGRANELIATGLRAGRPLDVIIPDVRRFLEESAASRGRRDGVRYAEFTINNPKTGLRPVWEAKQLQHTPRPAPELAKQSPAPLSTDREAAPSVAEPTSLPVATPHIPVSSFVRSPEDREKDAFYITQSLRDGQTPIQIRENMLEWLFKDDPGASQYVHAAIIEAQTRLRAEDLVSSATRHIQQYGADEPELYRALLQQLPAGEGVLRSAVSAISKAADLLPTGVLPPPLPLEHPDGASAAFHLAVLGFTHSDTARSIEVALAAKFNHDALKEGIPAQIIQIVQQASLIKQHSISTYSPELPA